MKTWTHRQINGGKLRIRRYIHNGFKLTRKTKNGKLEQGKSLFCLPLFFQPVDFFLPFPQNSLFFLQWLNYPQAKKQFK